MGKADNPNTDTSVSTERQKPVNKRYEFASYAETRDFLDQLADLSKREDYYPNVSFGKTYANISIDDEGQAVLHQRNSPFISDMDILATSCKL